MTLDTEFSRLGKEVNQVAACWRALEISVAEDRPAGVGLAAADHLAEVVLDGTGEVEAATRATQGPVSAESLHTTASSLLNLRRRVDGHCRSHHAVSGLLRAVHGREQEWRGWAKSFHAGVDQCSTALSSAEDVMVRCWREAVELAEFKGCGATR
ncbi:hypothetical protein DMC64_32815 [Amycolatopsis sp. WAC 04197]|uniref:hypothetical protein n=1 Tax=Amycolatopsis sp. WAC 04197 TaxID=2203199 RepID=UPI000F795FA9|nr:hypothetical protein [Amycolatopsis sp. WAC 04197]RSN40566.1 hypothetical protein DMC64_32815 [Amycolatopsis sp. WAC 04197]